MNDSSSAVATVRLDGTPVRIAAHCVREADRRDVPLQAREHAWRLALRDALGMPGQWHTVASYRDAGGTVRTLVATEILNDLDYGYVVRGRDGSLR